jgi:heme-degrading monooxygenase HmoA
MTSTAIRVIVYYREPPGRAGALADAYRSAQEMLHGVPGLANHELMRSMSRNGGFALLMEWQSLRDFQAWERAMRMAGHPSPLRGYQDRSRPGGHYEVYAVAGTRRAGAPA